MTLDYSSQCIFCFMCTCYRRLDLYERNGLWFGAACKHISKSIRFFLEKTTLCNCAQTYRKYKQATEPEKQMKHESFFFSNWEKTRLEKRLCFLPVVLFNFSIRPIWLHLRQMNRVKYGRTRKSAFQNTDLFQILPVEPFRFVQNEKPWLSLEWWWPK